MIEQHMRPLLQAVFIDSVAKLLINKCNPHIITILSFLAGLLSALSLFVSPYLCVAFLLLSGYLDVLDGSLARLQDCSSQLGTMLDILSDRFVESFVIIAIFIYQPNIAWLGLLMMMSILVCVSSFLLVGIFSQNSSQKSFHYSFGLIERAETFIFFIIMILFPISVFYLGLIYTILVLWTTFYRCYEFYVFEKTQE